MRSRSEQGIGITAGICLLLPCGLAALAAPAQAAAQTVTTASANIEEPGGVRVEEDAPRRLLVSLGGVTFALSSQMNGTLELALSSLAGPTATAGGGMLLLEGRGGQILGGATQGSEAVSISLGGGAELGGTYGGRQLGSNLTLVLAQYNE